MFRRQVCGDGAPDGLLSPNSTLQCPQQHPTTCAPHTHPSPLEYTDAYTRTQMADVHDEYVDTGVPGAAPITVS